MKKELKEYGVVLLVMSWIFLFGASLLPVGDLTNTQRMIGIVILLVTFPFLKMLMTKVL